MKRFPVDLRQLRRVELFANQFVMELRDLERGAESDAALSIAEMTEGARHLLSAVEECCLKWRPIPLLGRRQIKAQLRILSRARKGRR